MGFPAKEKRKMNKPANLTEQVIDDYIDRLQNVYDTVDSGDIDGLISDEFEAEEGSSWSQTDYHNASVLAIDATKIIREAIQKLIDEAEQWRSELTGKKN